jgi:hypothetical protein
MDFTSKEYGIAKLKILVKKNDLFLFYSGTNSEERDRRSSDQLLRKMQCFNSKIFNRTTFITFEASVFNGTKYLVNGITYFVLPPAVYKILSKQMVNSKLVFLTFDLIVIKFNNKMYSTPQLVEIDFFEYFKFNLAFYQWCGIDESFFEIM